MSRFSTSNHQPPLHVYTAGCDMVAPGCTQLSSLAESLPSAPLLSPDNNIFPSATIVATHGGAGCRANMFSSLFGKSKALQEEEEVDVAVSQVGSYPSRASADSYPRLACWTFTSSTRRLLARVTCNMMLSTSDNIFGTAPRLTLVQYRGSTRTGRRRSQDLDSG